MRELDECATLAFIWPTSSAKWDVKATKLQAKGFNRDVYARSPREPNAKGLLCKQEAAAYGLVDLGRLWHLTSNKASTASHGLRRSTFDHALFYALDSRGELEFMLAT